MIERMTSRLIAGLILQVRVIPRGDFIASEIGRGK